MEAVKLDRYSLEAAPPVSRFTGSEAFSGTRVSAEPLDPPVERFCSLLGEGRAEPEQRSWSRFFNEAKHGPVLPKSRVEDVKLFKKGGKAAKNSSCCPKKSSISRAEDHAVFIEVDDLLSDKGPLMRQKNVVNCKRSDRRNSKSCARNKFEFVSMKTSLTGCITGSGGNGVSGLKTAEDISKHVDDISLDDLLDGTYVCSTLRKEEEAKSNRNVDILESVKKACGIFQQVKLSRTENVAESDCCSSEKTASASFVNSCFLDQDSTNSESPPNLFDFPFAQPLDTLDRISLSPSKDLDSLLLDAAKSISHCRISPESRVSKQAVRGWSLPPFSWSNGNHSKSNDVAKLQNRITCHGRWVRLGNSVSSPNAFSHSFHELDSLAFDESLIPNLPGKTTSIVISPPMVPQVEYSSKQVRAAQTLCDMSRDKRIVKWSKIPKARKLKLQQESLQSASKSRKTALDYKVSSKRAKHSDNEMVYHLKGRGPLSWSTSKSSRSSSSPSKSAMNLVRGEGRTKQKRILPPPPAKGVARETNNQRKVRKLMHMDWNKE